MEDREEELGRPLTRSRAGGHPARPWSSDDRRRELPAAPATDRPGVLPALPVRAEDGAWRRAAGDRRDRAQSQERARRRPSSPCREGDAGLPRPRADGVCAGPPLVLRGSTWPRPSSACRGDWDPRTLPQGGPARASDTADADALRAVLVVRASSGCCSSRRRHSCCSGLPAAFVDPAPIWRLGYLPIVLLTAATAVLYGVNFFRPYWTQGRSVAKRWRSHVASFIVFAGLFGAGEWFVASSASSRIDRCPSQSGHRHRQRELRNRLALHGNFQPRRAPARAAPPECASSRARRLRARARNALTWPCLHECSARDLASSAIRKTYGRTVAVDDVSFDVQPGRSSA